MRRFRIMLRGTQRFYGEVEIETNDPDLIDRMGPDQLAARVQTWRGESGDPYLGEIGPVDVLDVRELPSG